MNKQEETKMLVWLKGLIEDLIEKNKKQTDQQIQDAIYCALRQDRQYDPSKVDVTFGGMKIAAAPAEFERRPPRRRPGLGGSSIAADVRRPK